MEILDLTKHEPEEYEGKLVTCIDCNYMVGAYIGSGQARIVHKLINEKSGLCLHVIKIWRSIEEAKDFVKNININEFAKSDKIAIIYITVFSHGGAFEIQQFVGPYEDGESFTGKTTIEAQNKLRNDSLSYAIELYDKVLKINEYHTVALNNKAHALQKLGKYYEAFDLIHKANDIEPNDQLNLYNFITTGRQCGYLRLCRTKFEEFKSKFPLSLNVHKSGIYLYLDSGEPFKAKKLLTESKKDIKESDDIEKNINENIASQKKAREYISSTKRLGSTPLERKKSVVDILTTANKMYPYDFQINLNLAFSLYHISEFREAKNIFYSLINTIYSKHVKFCIASAAFCEMKLSKYEQAFSLIRDLMDIIKVEADSYEKLDPWGVPRPGIWMKKDGIVLQEPPNSTLIILENVIKKSKQKGIHIANEVFEIYELYKLASK